MRRIVACLALGAGLWLASLGAADPPVLFRDVTKEAGLAWVGHSQGATLCDADGDGDLDLFLSNTATWITETYEPLGKYYTGVSTIVQMIESPPETNVLFRNNGDGTFTDATEETGVAFGIENHGGTTNDPEFLKPLFEAVGSKRLGLTLDTGRALE